MSYFCVMEKLPANPDWTRDEIILALDLYFKLNRYRIDHNNPEIIALSEYLRHINIHPGARKNPSFRNANGVAMKLSNFLRLDPAHTGTGLMQGSKLEQQLWDEFYERQDKLHEIANQIRAFYQTNNPLAYTQPDEVDANATVQEGGAVYRMHKSYERSYDFAKKKKKLMLAKHGKLACEACGFDFHKTYGELGKDFIECHHITPIHKKGKSSTTFDDLALVCSNCHRMLHRNIETMSIADLKKLIRNHH